MTKRKLPFDTTLETKPKEAKLQKPESTESLNNLNDLISNSGFSHITQNILKNLDSKSQLNCRLVCTSMKSHVDQPVFWIKKLDQKDMSKDLRNSLIELLQWIEKESDIQEELRKCLMKFFGGFNGWSKTDLDGMTPIHLAAGIGHITLVKFIGSKYGNFDAPMPNEASITAIIVTYLRIAEGFSKGNII